MTTEDTAFPPALDITYTVPAMAATAEMSVPVFTQTGDVIAPPRVRGVGNGVVQVWELEEILRSEYTYLVPAMQARATMGKPRLIVSEIPMDEDLSLLLELELV